MLRSALRKRDVSRFFADASTSVDQTRRSGPRRKGISGQLLKECNSLSDGGRAYLRALIGQSAIKPMARSLFYREHFREILKREQTSVVSAMLKQSCITVLPTEVGPTKNVVRMIRKHFDGIVAWIQQIRQTPLNLTAIYLLAGELEMALST